MPDLTFEYAIKFPNGTYYTGRVNSDEKPNYWQGKKDEAFTFTEFGAHNKINNGFCFKDCIVERIL